LEAKDERKTQNMKKIHMLIAALLAFLPTVLFADTGSSTTYYAALKAQVSSSGGGKVYASTSSSTPSSSSFGSGNTAQNSGSSDSFTFYAHAQANEGYKFKNWTGDFSSTDNPYKASVTATSTSSSTYTTKTITANFEPLPPATVTFAAPANGSYTVNGESVSAQLVKSNQAVPYSVTLVATPASNFRFAGWYTLENDVKSFFSTDATTTKKFDVDVTVGAEFVPDGYAIYAAVAGKGYDDLATALSEALPGESISVYSSTTLGATAAVDAGVSLTVASGVTLTVASGATLYVDGNATVNGTISGTVSKCTKLIQQTGQSDGVPFNPYGTVKYWKTSITTPSISISSSATHTTIVNGLGQVFRPTLSSSAKLIKCTIDASVAVNHIKSIAGESTSVNVVNDTLNSGMVILLGSDCVINGGLGKAGFRGVVDCAGFACTTVSGQEVTGNNGLATFLNCPSFTISKCVNITHDYYNCDSVSISTFNAGNTPTLKFYDCGTVANPASFSVTYYSSGPSATTTHNFYSGYYNSLSYKTCYKVYGGSFKNDPSNYNADVDNLEVVYDSVGKWYVVQTATPAEKVVSIGTKEYASLSEAVGKAVNGETISLIAAVDMAGETVTVPEGKNITISLDKHSISNGKIINNGALTIMDSTIANEGEVNCDIENNGTLDFVFGTYAGSVVNNSGTLTVHNGAFTKSFISAGGTVNLKGGHYKPDISGFVADEGYLVHSSGGFYWVCELPDGTLRKTTVSGASGYCATPYDDDDYILLKERVVNTKTTKSDYTAANWVRLAELLTFYEVFYNKSLDATLQFDRAVTAKSLNVYAATTVSLPLQIKQNLAANELYRGLSAALVSNGYYGKQYKALWEDKIQSVSLAIADGSSGSNAGTVCRMMIELWDSSRAPDYHDPDNKHMLTNTVLIVGEQRFTIGAGTNKAMIRPETGAANFYKKVTDALAAADDGATIMLTQDCEEDVVLAKAGSFKIDQNGFVLTGTVTAGGDYFIEKDEDGTYTVAKKGIVDENGKAQASIQEVVDAAGEGEKEVVITIPETTTEQTVELPQDTTLTVVQAEGSETVVNVTPVDGYFVEATVVEPTEEQSGTTTVYESKKITEEVVTVTEESVKELSVKLEEFQVGSTETNEVVEVDQIVKAVNNLMENKALERADNVEQAKSETINLKAIVITPKVIVQEVSATTEETVVKAAAFDVTPTDTNGKKIENTSFTFRLPVADGMTGSMVVFHKKAFFGVYPILSWSDGAKLHKYIEITSSEFSEYSYEPRRGVEYAVAKIGDVGYDSLEDAVAAAAAGAKVELLKSTTLTNEIAVAKAVTLDLGEYTVTAASGKNAIQVAAGGSLTIEATTGGITAASGFAVYTDYELSQGVKSVTINGGVFDGALQFNKYPLQTSAAQSGESATPTTVAINDGTFNGNVKIYRCPTTIAGGTFEQGLDTSSSSVSVYSNSKTPVRVIGGKFKTEPVSVGNRVFVSAGYYDGGYFVVGDTSVCQAKRNGKFYRSVAEAFAAVGADTRIEILNGADVSGINVTLGEGQSLTVPSSFTAVAAANGYTLHTDVNTADGTVTYTAYVDGAVARIGGQHYASLDAAFEAAQDGDTITLVADATLGATAISAEVTLALAEHSVNVATTGINLTGKLTVTGVGLVSAVPALSGNGELVILGGTWTADPSAFVPQVVTALPGEQDDKAWTKDRCYVFANKAFVDGGWGDAEGLYTVVPLPKAYVTTMSEKPEVGGYGVLDCAYTFESFSSANGDDAIAAKFLEGGFSAFSDPVELARAKELLMEKMPFLDWNADFVVSLDGAADAGDLMLSGHYAQWDIGWVSYESPSTIDANQKVRLLVDIGQATPGDWPYENICRYVRTFDCGAKKLKSAMDGKTMTVQLRLYKPGEDEGLGSPSILICEYKYTFGGYAAKIVRSNETLRYATLAEAFAAVQANETIQLLNDYTGAADLSGCEVSFTLDKNGFGLAITGEPTTEEDWFFEKMSNDNWFHYYKKPATEEAPVVTVEVVDEDGETMSLSTLTPDAEWLDDKVQEGESAEEALAKVEENGLTAWQNYVLGQDASTAARVDGEQSSDVSDMPVVNTFAGKENIPEDSGFTVSYSLDQVSSDGTVVSAGTPTNDANAEFSIDLSKVETDAYYKLTAVIETTDGSGAKTKVASENTIGVLKVESSATSTVIAVPWESLAADGQDITVSDLVRTATLTEGDELKVYDTATGKYRAWTLNASKEWEPVTVVGGAKSEEASDSTIARGSGVWLTRQDTTQPIYLVGEVAEQSTTTTIAGAQDDEPTWNLVAAPTVESVDLNEKFPDANEGDVVMVPTETAPRRYTYENGSWGYTDYEEVKTARGIKVVKPVRKTDVTEVPAGTGFWYSNAGEEKDVEW
jgi:hypothetical protein